MAQPQRRAEFFVRLDGVCVPKAPPLKERERFEFFEASDRSCKGCGREIACLGVRIDRPRVEGQIDHILARSRGGQNEPANLRLLCVSCNASKGAK
jgi:5-methylcytosine-specific restriction endonuclease McrA